MLSHGLNYTMLIMIYGIANNDVTKRKVAQQRVLYNPFKEYVTISGVWEDSATWRQKQVMLIEQQKEKWIVRHE